MILVLATLLLVVPALARVWPVNSAATLLDAVRRSTAGDQVLLDPGDYIMRSPTPGQPALVIDHPLVLQSRDPRQRAVLRGDSVPVLIAITSPNVKLWDLIVGKQASGGDERSIDVYIASGTQTLPASRTAGYNGALSPQSLESRGEILSAREIQTKKRSTLGVKASAFQEEMRALNDIVLSRVDFTRSLSGTNVAFARGSYADVNVGGCAFGRDGAHYINAIVSVAEAQFVELGIHGNAFYADAHVLLGSGAVPSSAVGMNYWAVGGRAASVFLGSERRARATYCLSSQCDRVAPVVDADDQSSTATAYASMEDAFAAGVRHVRLTDDVELDSVLVLQHSDTTIEGGQGCEQGAPMLTIRSGAAIVASPSATLSGVRNVRITLEGARTTAFVFTDGSPQRLMVARDLTPLLTTVAQATTSLSEIVTLLDGVSILGDGATDQTAFVLNAPGLRVELQDVFVGDVDRAAVVHRGALILIDSTVVRTRRSAVYAETATHQAALRVSGSTFIGCESGVELGATASSTALQEFSIQCSTFLFNTRRLPIVAHDCVRKPAICAAAVRYNSIISDHPATAEKVAAADEVETRMLRQGANHVEHGRVAEQYVFAGEPRHFSLKDTQGRLSWVSGSLVGVQAKFLVASYVPVRAECLAPGDALQSAQAAVVSDVLEVRADSLLHQCSAIGVRFRLSDEKTLPESLAVYGVARLGTTQPVWTRALATVQRENNEATLEATLATHDSAQRHQHRVLVVALELVPDAISAALDSGAALVSDTPRAVGRRLCVVCGASGAKVPAHALDDYCGGTTENVRTSFDDAYEELQFGVGTGAPRQEAVSLFVFGECTMQRRCTAVLDQNEHIEGLSAEQNGVLRRAHCAADAQAPLIQFTPRASKASLRFMMLDSKPAVQCAVHVTPSSVQLGPLVANNYINGGFCSLGRSGGRYLNNEIAGDVTLQFADVANTAAATTLQTTPTLFEANVVHGKQLQVLGGGGNNEEVRITRNMFGGAAALRVGGKRLAVHIVSNVDLVALESSGEGVRVSAIDNKFSAKVPPHVSLHDTDTLSGGVEHYLMPAGSVIELAGKSRLLNTIVPRKASVQVEVGGAVVLREVAFEDIGGSLNPKRTCVLQEVSPGGLDLTRSQIYVGTNGNWARVLLAEEQRAIDADQSYFWRRPDAALVQCPEAKPFSRAGGRQCGCANTAPPGVRAVVQKEQKVLEKAKVLADDDSSTSSSTLAIVLAIVGAVVLICICVACVFAFSSGVFGSASRAALTTTTAAMASRAREPEATDEHVASRLDALRIRKAFAANE